MKQSIYLLFIAVCIGALLANVRTEVPIDPIVRLSDRGRGSVAEIESERQRIRDCDTGRDIGPTTE